MAEHDIFINTNVVDNMPVSVLEVSAAGLVPVATAVGGIPKLLTDDVNSVLVPTGDDEAMADVVLALLADQERVERLSAGARRVAEDSGWDRVRTLWEAQFASLLPRPDGP
ncbi:MAG: glycosyltransferase [Microthrixaceae bacterium]